MRDRSTAEGYRSFELPECLPALDRGDPEGRFPGHRVLACDRQTLVWSQSLDPETPAVFKLYRRRGIVGWHREKASRFRVQREFDSLGFIDSRGIPCSRPLFWTFGRSAEFGRYEILVTREIENAVPLLGLCQEGGRNVDRAVLARAYELAGLMHRHGCHHGALYPKNILVARGRPDAREAVFVIDMPRAILFPYDITGTRIAWIDLFCLTNQVVRFIGAEECVPLLAAYGLAESAARKFLAGAGDFRLQKLARNLFRGECEAWELLSRVGIRCFRSSRLQG